MKKTTMYGIMGAVSLTVAIGASFGSAIVVLKAMQKIGPAMMEAMPVAEKLNLDAVWITALILIMWSVDLFVRPLINDLLKSFLKYWEKSEVTEDGHATATAKDA